MIAFSSEKAALSESGEKYAQIKLRLQAKTVQNHSKQISVDNRGWTFSLEEAVLWIMDILSRSDGLKVNTL